MSDLLIKLVFQGSKMVASLGRVWGEAVARRSRRVGSCVPSYWAFFACLSSLLLSVMMTGCVGESGVVVATGNVSRLFEGKWTSSCTEVKAEELALPRPAVLQWVLSDGVSELRIFFYRSPSCGGEPREAQVFRGYVTIGSEVVPTESGIPAFPMDFQIDPTQSSIAVDAQVRLGVIALINNLLYMMPLDMTTLPDNDRVLTLDFVVPYFADL